MTLSALPLWQPPSPDIVENLLEGMKFDQQGLVAAIAQDEERNVLMLAWMDQAALRETLLTGRVCYFSRRRGKLWRKGERSGQTQSLLAIAFDCDRDALLLTVNQVGVACHTGRRSCFYFSVTSRGPETNSAPLIPPEILYRPGSHP